MKETDWMENVCPAPGSWGIQPQMRKYSGSCHGLPAGHLPLLPSVRETAAPCSGAIGEVAGGPGACQAKTRSIATHQEMLSVTSLLTGYLKLYNSKPVSKSPHIKVQHLP